MPPTDTSGARVLRTAVNVALSMAHMHRQPIHVVLVPARVAGRCPGKTASHSHFNVFVVTQSGPPPPQQGLLTYRVLRHLVEVVADILMTSTRLVQGRIARVMESGYYFVVHARVEFQFSVLDKVRGEFHMNHLCRLGVFELSPRYGRNSFSRKFSGAIHGVHVLMNNPPHVAAFASQYPFHTQTFGLRVYFCVEPL